MDMYSDIRDFHRKFELEYDGKPRVLNSELAEFRLNFMKEELSEYERHARFAAEILASDPSDEASIAHHLEEMVDALADLTYVVLGTAYMHGFDFNEVWRRVQEANMKKVRAKCREDSKRASTFDVVKPHGWEPPRHIDLVEDHAHRNGGA